MQPTGFTPQRTSAMALIPSSPSSTVVRLPFHARRTVDDHRSLSPRTCWSLGVSTVVFAVGDVSKSHSGSHKTRLYASLRIFSHYMSSIPLPYVSAIVCRPCCVKANAGFSSSLDLFFPPSTCGRPSVSTQPAMPLVQVTSPPASVIEVDIDYDAHFERAWDVFETLWATEESERRQRAVAAATCDRSSRLFDSSFAASNSSSMPHPAPPFIANQPSPHHTHTPPFSEQPDVPSDRPAAILRDSTSADSPPAPPSELPSSPSSRVSYIDDSELSDCDSDPPEGSRKRKRRANWSPEKIAREKARNKAKKERRRQAGTLRPRKKSDAQKARKKVKRAAEMLARESDSNYDGPTPSGYRLPKNALRTWGIPIEVPVDYEMEKASAAEGAYVGINRPVDRTWGTDDYTLEGERTKGRTVLKWDGMYVVFPSSRSPSFLAPFISFTMLIGNNTIAHPTPSSTRKGECW